MWEPISEGWPTADRQSVVISIKPQETPRVFCIRRERVIRRTAMATVHQVAMVASASRGLGFAVASALAGEGALVSMASRNEAAIFSAAKQIENAGGRTPLAFVADVTNPEAIIAWHQATVAKLGIAELLVTNSGGPAAGAALSFDDGSWKNAFDLLFLSALRLVRAVVPGMTTQGRGAIVMMTSSSVKEPIANLDLSNVLRPTVAALAKTLANHYASAGVRVNHVIPGRIATDRVRELDEIGSRKNGITIEEEKNLAVGKIPSGRYGEPDEFARTVAFFFSNAAAPAPGATFPINS
jgi:3-oxoacyl-[acyl-carrier protein] reductase